MFQPISFKTINHLNPTVKKTKTVGFYLQHWICNSPRVKKIEKIYLFVVIFLILTPLLCFSSMNWIIIWLCLEINTITFSFLIRHTNMQAEGIECGLKYFILQSRASACMLFCIIIFAEKTAKIKMGLPLLLLFKLGIVPIHTWFVLVGSKINWSMLTVLITWQKMIPIYLIIYSLKLLSIARAILSIIFGTILQYKNIKRKSLIIYSRISNSCWIVIAITINIQLIVVFLYNLLLLRCCNHPSNKSETTKDNEKKNWINCQFHDDFNTSRNTPINWIPPKMNTI